MIVKYVKFNYRNRQKSLCLPTEINYMDNKCKVCGNTNKNKTFCAKEMMLGLKDEFIYFQCSECNCLQIAEFPQDISKYYPSENYYSFNSSKNKIITKKQGWFKRNLIRANVVPNSYSKRIIKNLFVSRNVNFLSELKINRSTKILDVGCGDGMKFLFPLYEAGFTKILGCDPFINENINYSNGLKILKKYISEISGEWDIICFNHSFEHISNPLFNLKKAYDLLPLNGKCIIRIPTSSSFAWKKYGINWFQLDAPRHFFLHSVESMQLLAMQSGFTIDKVKYDSTHHQFTVSERYQSGKTFEERTCTNLAGRIASIFEKINYLLKAKSLNRLNQGDQAIFYLCKN